MERRKIGLFVSDPVPNAVGRLANLVLTANFTVRHRFKTWLIPLQTQQGKPPFPTSYTGHLEAQWYLTELQHQRLW